MERKSSKRQQYCTGRSAQSSCRVTVGTLFGLLCQHLKRRLLSTMCVSLPLCGEKACSTRLGCQLCVDGVCLFNVFQRPGGHSAERTRNMSQWECWRAEAPQIGAELEKSSACDRDIGSIYSDWLLLRTESFRDQGKDYRTWGERERGLAILERRPPARSGATFTRDEAIYIACRLGSVFRVSKTAP